MKENESNKDGSKALYYNSLFFYIVKGIKGTPLFSVFYTLFFASIVSVLYSILILFKYSGFFVGMVNIPFKVMIAIILSLFALFVISGSIIAVKHVFVVYSRLFSSFLMFGIYKLSLLKLVVVQTIIYSLMSILLSMLVIGVLYAVFFEFINAIVSVDNLFNVIKYFLYSCLSTHTLNLLVVTLLSSIFLTKDPYEVMRSSL